MSFSPALFLSVAKATVNIKLLKPQSEESFRGENPHFENICISSSSFVLLLKAAFCTDHRGCLHPKVPQRTSGPSRKPSLAINNLTGTSWPNNTKTDQVGLFFFVLSFISGESTIRVTHAFRAKCRSLTSAKTQCLVHTQYTESATG